MSRLRLIYLALAIIGADVFNRDCCNDGLVMQPELNLTFRLIRNHGTNPGEIFKQLTNSSARVVIEAPNGFVNQ